MKQTYADDDRAIGRPHALNDLVDHLLAQVGDNFGHVHVYDRHYWSVIALLELRATVVHDSTGAPIFLEIKRKILYKEGCLRLMGELDVHLTQQCASGASRGLDRTRRAL